MISIEEYKRISQDERPDELIELFLEASKDFLAQQYTAIGYDVYELLEDGEASEHIIKIVLVALTKNQLNSFYQEDIPDVGEVDSMSISMDGYSLSYTPSKTALSLSYTQKEMLGLNKLTYKKVVLE